MIELNNLILVGGGSRNLGKTEFVSQLIAHTKEKYDIIALKIKTIYEGDNFFHGKDLKPLKSDYEITEYTKSNDSEDTSRMLQAGAKKVFKIKAKNNYLGIAFSEFLSKTNTENKLIICESNSLRDYVIPQYFFIILGTENAEIKPSAQRLLKYANKIVYSDGKNFDINIKKLNFTL